MTVLYILATVWWVVALRRLGKKVPSMFKWGWLIGAVVMVSFIIQAIIDTIK